QVEDRPVHTFRIRAVVDQGLGDPLEARVVSIVRHPRALEYAVEDPDEVRVDHGKAGTVSRDSDGPADVLADTRRGFGPAPARSDGLGEPRQRRRTATV